MAPGQPSYGDLVRVHVVHALALVARSSSGVARVLQYGLGLLLLLPALDGIGHFQGPGEGQRLLLLLLLLLLVRGQATGRHVALGYVTSWKLRLLTIASKFNSKSILTLTSVLPHLRRHVTAWHDGTPRITGGSRSRTTRLENLERNILLETCLKQVNAI